MCSRELNAECIYTYVATELRVPTRQLNFIQKNLKKLFVSYIHKYIANLQVSTSFFKSARADRSQATCFILYVCNCGDP
jgi:hypothetical protein